MLILFGLVIAVIGVLGIAAPSTLLDFGRSLQTPFALYIVAAIRIGFGIALIRVAAISRTPKTFRILGVPIIIAGVVTPFIGVERARMIVDWWFAQGAWLMQIWAGLAVIFGLFIVYALTPRR
ncbi:hypothetical protein [Paraherbaspirillum soli]|uniref:hypothetical protein n=1 Tax=Paraherbaspirillum soli TaxID=631222 RepID=UPI00366E9E86